MAITICSSPEQLCSESYCRFDRYQEQQQDIQTKENIFLGTGIFLRGTAESLLTVSESLVRVLKPAKLPRPPSLRFGHNSDTYFWARQDDTEWAR